MAHATTIPAQVCTGLPSPACAVLDTGHHTRRRRVAVDGRRFRVQTPQGSTPWLPATPSHRHLSVVWLRRLVDEHGRPWFTWQAGAPSVGRANRPAASPHVEDVRRCGEDVRAFVLRTRNVAATVVEGVLPALLQTPFAGPAELALRVKAQWGRNDLRAAHIEGAVEQIAGVPVRRVRRRQLESGPVPDQEAWLLTALLESQASPAVPSAGGRLSSAEHGMRLADPTALAALVTPDLPRAQVPGSRCGLTFLMTLFDWKVPLAVLGRWCGVHQTTIVRWRVGLAVAGWPLVYHWMGERVKAQRVDGAEQWLKIRGRWHDWCVVGDGTTELPVRGAGRPSRSPWACRGLGAQLCQLTKIPRVLITEGGQAYADVVPAATQVWCRVHHQQRVTHWLQPHVTTEAALNTRKPMMKQVLQTRDQRPVRRRLARWRERAAAGGLTPWISRVDAKLPGLICTVGRVRLPSTTNAIERFVRAFQRLYATRGGVHSVRSATRELVLFLVVYVFTPHATTGQAPLEVIVPEARRMPLYRLINDPFRALQERASVQSEATMADLLRPQATGA